MNSKEWLADFNARPFGLDDKCVHRIIADLAACEAELFSAQQALLTEGQARNAAEADRDSWKAIVERDTKCAAIVLADRDDLRRKLSDASIANAAMRGALNFTRQFGHAQNGERCELCEKVNAALALPTDGLAEEVVWLLKSAMHGGSGEAIRDWSNRRDALLAKLGGKP